MCQLGRGNQSLRAPHPHQPSGIRPVSFAHQIPYEEVGSPSEQPVLEGRGAKGSQSANWDLFSADYWKPACPMISNFTSKNLFFVDKDV